MIIHNQVRRMVGAAVAAAMGRLDLEASGNITEITVANPDPHGYGTGSMRIRIRMDPGTGSVFALFGMRIRILMLKLLSDFVKRSM
jgi:hypothetical protein